MVSTYGSWHANWQCRRSTEHGQSTLKTTPSQLLCQPCGRREMLQFNRIFGLDDVQLNDSDVPL
jgi:hypothetical protein